MKYAKEEILGAWNSGKGYSAQIVFKTPYGTAHAGATRKWYMLPDEIRKDAHLLQKINAALSEKPPQPKVSFGAWPKPHPLLMADDSELAAALARFRDDPVATKIPLNDWEFRFVCDAPGVYEKYRGFTWKQRKYLREIVKKILG